MTTNYPIVTEEKVGEKFTALTKMLMMLAPEEGVVPDGYEENYITAYRRCQDKPGGESLVYSSYS